MILPQLSYLPPSIQEQTHLCFLGTALFEQPSSKLANLFLPLEKEVVGNIFVLTLVNR